MYTVSLNTNLRPVYFLPNRFHLSFENPGPIEIDTSEYSSQEIAWLKKAKDSQILFIQSTESNSELDKPVSSPQQVQAVSLKLEAPKVVENIVPTTKEDFKASVEKMVFNQYKNKEQAALQTLSISLTRFKSFINKEKDIKYVKTLLEVEVKNKNRESFLKRIRERLQELNSSLSSSIGPPVETIQKLAKQDQDKIEDLVDEDEFDVTIDIGSETE